MLQLTMLSEPPRIFTVLVALLLSCIAARAHAGDPFEMTWRELADGVWVGVRPMSYRTPVVTNTTVVIGDTGVLVFDAAGIALQGERLVEQVAEFTAQPITHIAISHWHGDHSMGDHAVLARYPDAKVIAHEFTARYIASPNMDSVEPPDPKERDEYRQRVQKALDTGVRSDGSPVTPSMRAFYEHALADFDFVNEEIQRRQVMHPTGTITDKRVIDLGGRVAELRHIAPGNTKGDMFLWLPHEKILATGDIVVRPTPYGFFSYPESWAGVLRELQTYDARYIVPGHGEIITDTAYLGLLAETMDLVARQVDRAAAAGKTLEETRDAMDWQSVEGRFTGGDAMLALIFNLWFKTPIVEAQYMLATGKDNESLEPLPEEANPYAAFEYLIGTWDTGPPGQPAAVQRFSWGPEQSYIWYATATIGESGTEHPHFEGMIVWNAAEEKMDFLAILEPGTLAQERGSLHLEEDGTIIRDVTATDAQGEQGQFRQTFRQTGPDSAVTSLMRETPTGWTPNFPGSNELLMLRRK